MQAKRFVSAAVIAAITAGLILAGAGSASALSSAESSFVSKINHERTSRGIKALTVASDLVSVARKHSAQMAAKGEIYHNDNLANDVDNWFVLGENVGMGPDVDSLHKAFMNSPHHRDNILYKDYNIIGVGVVVDGDGQMFVTEVFAGRKSATHTTTTTVTHTTTRRTSSSATTSTRSATSHVAARAATATAHATATASAARAVPQTVALLVRMVGLDANDVNPATGAASKF